MEGGCPPAVDMLHLRGCTHEMTPSPSSLAGMVSCNVARCLCQNGVKGHSSTNDHNWRSSLWKEYELADMLLDARSNSSFPLVCFGCVSFIISAFCPFHNPKSNVLLPHVGLLMLLFNDCQDLCQLFVIYGRCEELILGNMHYIYSLIWFPCALEKAVINYRNLMEWGTVKLYEFPTGKRDKETAEEAVLWKGDLYATSVGDSILDSWHKLRGIA